MNLSWSTQKKKIMFEPGFNISPEKLLKKIHVNIDYIKNNCETWSIEKLKNNSYEYKCKL